MTRGDDSVAPPQRPTVLQPGDVEAIAVRVVELLDRPTPRLLTAAELARLLVVDVAFVYAHQHELGVLRLPGGRRPALRFDRDVVLERLRGDTESPRARTRRRPAPRRTTPQSAELLPYEPRAAA